MPLHTVKPLVKSFDARRVKPEAKKADPIYSTPEYRAFRKSVMQRAGWRCEVVEQGKRCTNRHPHQRMYADHIKELRDGGAPFDPMNGMCKCASHHTAKTAAQRAARLAEPSATGVGVVKSLRRVGV
jgi:hypothetical protein